jgi:hypothetical protein
MGLAVGAVGDDRLLTAELDDEVLAHVFGEAVEWARRAPLIAGNTLEVRRVTDETDFAAFADNEYIQKEEGWREEQAAR